MKKTLAWLALALWILILGSWLHFNYPSFARFIISSFGGYLFFALSFGAKIVHGPPVVNNFFEKPYICLNEIFNEIKPVQLIVLNLVACAILMTKGDRVVYSWSRFIKHTTN